MKTETISHGVQQRITTALFVSQSLFSAAIIAAFTLMPIIAAELSGNDSTAGYPSTLSLIGRAAAAYPIGWIMDRAGRRWGLTLGYGLSVLGSIVAVWSIVAGSFVGFCVGALLVGFGRSSSEQGRYVAAEVYPAARRAKVIGLIVFAGTIGAVGGPLLVDPSGQLAARYDMPTAAGPFVIATVLYLLALLVAFLFLRPDPLDIGRTIAQTDIDQANPETERPLRQIFSKPLVQLAVASMVIGQLVMVLLMTITPLHMNHHNHGTQAISFVIMAHTLGMFGLSSVTGWLIDKYGRIVMIVIGALVLILSSVMTPFAATVPLLAAALFLLGLGWNFCFVAGSSLLSDALTADERGRAQGAGEVLVALAAGTGSFSTGSVFAHGGITAVSAVGLAFSLALVGILVWHNASRRLQHVEA
ncbi:MAG: MFS transporter [Anaerolineales bacterium]|nr:MFS transporter [Anaerolineales bacterium]